MGGAPEGPVLLNAHRQDPVIGAIGVAVCFVRQDVAHLGLVWIGGQQIDVIGARLSLGPFEVMTGVEIDIVALLGKSPAGLAMKVDQQVVVELSVVKQGAAGARITVGRCRGFDEPVEYRQRMGQARVDDDRAGVFRSVERIDESGPSRGAPLTAGGGDVPAHHLAWAKGAGRDACPVDSVSCGPVPAVAIVAEGHGHFRLEHHSVVQLSRSQRLEGWRDMGRDLQVIVVRQHWRVMLDIGNDRPQQFHARVVRLPGCRRREITLRLARFGGDGGQQFGQDQQVGTARSMVQALDRQDIGAHVEKVELGDTELDRIDGEAVGTIGRGAGVPGLRGRHRGIVPRYFLAIDIGDHSVFIPHAQRQCLNC